LVANRARRRIHASKPITGADAFRHESGIHTAALLRNAAAYQPFPSEETGRAPEPFAIGKHSGSAGIRSLLAASGISVPASLCPEILSAVRRRAREHKQAVSPQELSVIALALLSLGSPDRHADMGP
jgi:homocitrate synthase NifV